MSNAHALEIPLDQLRAAFHHHNLCRKEAGVGDDDVLLDRIKEMNAEIARLRETIISNSATYESERFALKSEIEELREAIESALRFANHPDIEDRTEALGVLRDIREALAAHTSVCSHCGGTRYVATRGDTGVVKRPCCWCQDKHAPVAEEKPV